MNAESPAKNGFLGMLLGLLGIGKTPTGTGSAPESLPYRLRDDFLSAAEASFYHVLRQVVGERATVCPKVGLGDLFFVVRPNENQGARNRIAAKHVDFVLCDPATMRPLAGIELDDASHTREDRKERDVLVEKIFKAAGLPLLRFPVQRSYALAEVNACIAPVFGSGESAPAISPDAASEPADGKLTAPLCPKCGVSLMIRTSARGRFFGCPNFPKCRETAQLA